MNINLKSLEEKYSEIESRSEDALSSFMADALSRSRVKVISKGALYNVRPYEIERAGFKRGRQVKKLPTNIKNTHVYHLDDDGKIVLAEIYGQAENIVSHEFYRYGTGFIDRFYFTSVGKLRNISISLLDEEVVVKDLNWGGMVVASRITYMMAHAL